MANGIHFGNEHDGRDTERMTCEVCEAMCLDAVDSTLTLAEQTAFELHVAGCAVCAEQFAEAQRGAAWMEMLKAHRPEPSSSLLANILARTSGAEAELASRGTVGFADAHPNDAEAVVRTRHPAYGPFVMPAPTVMLPAIVAAPVVASGGNLLQFRRRMASSVSFSGSHQMYFQPRLAMTAAMAFFSIALTMNLTGTRLTDLRPGAIHRTVADAGANAVRSFQGLKVVYQVESKVNELRQGDDRNDTRDPIRDPGGPFGDSRESAPPKQAEPATEKPKPTAPNGSSELQLPEAPALRQVGSDKSSTLNEAHVTPQKGA